MRIRALGFGAAAVCAICVAIIAYTWHQHVSKYTPWPGQLADQVSVEQYLQSLPPIEDGAELPIYIPTGAFIQSVAFVSASDVNITGYIWQKYGSDVPGDISRGFVLPEQVNSGDTVIEQTSRQQQEGGELFVWYFDVTLRQPFNYSNYPLDRHDVWIRMWHKDFHRNVILVPDLDSYDSTEQGVAFGLDGSLVPGGWLINETYFRYHEEKYDTNFGIKDYVGKENFPELHFNIVMSRNFLNAFIVNLVPLLVVATLLFAELMMLTRAPALAGRFDLSTAGAIGTVAALFFVVMIAHIQLREQFAGAQVVYLEYFYLAVYVMLMLTALNAYLFALDNKWAAFISDNNNLIPKLSFWPVLFGALALVTVLKLGVA
jgi:hypothetical protein